MIDNEDGVRTFGLFQLETQLLAIGGGNGFGHGGLGKEISVAVDGVAVHKGVGREWAGVDVGDNEGPGGTSGPFKQSSLKVLDTAVSFLRPNLAVLHWTWSIKGAGVRTQLPMNRARAFLR